MDTKNVKGGFPILGILGVAFIILKLVGVLAWSWWWVLAPFWIGPALALVVLVIWLLLVLIGKGIDNWPWWGKRS